MVYVGTRQYLYGGMKMSHMAADTLDELHLMAFNIGVDRRHFQMKPGKPHYDISQKMKARALLLGAKHVNDRDLIRMYRESIIVVEEIDGMLYSVRPNTYSNTCPYCGRVKKIPKNTQARGFSHKPFASHLFSCFTKVLNERGYIELPYDMEVLRFPVIKK